MSSSSHSLNLIKRTYLKYANPFPFANTESKDLCEEKFKEIEDRLIQRNNKVGKKISTLAMYIT